MLNEFKRKLYDTIEANNYIATFADPARDLLFTDHYAYSVVSTVALTSTPQDFVLTMDTDSDFVALYASGAASREAAIAAISVIPNPAILIQVKENWSGKTWFNVPTLLPLVAGQTGYPFIQPSPRVIPARSSITVTASAAHTSASFAQFNFTLHGGRNYYR